MSKKGDVTLMHVIVGLIVAIPVLIVLTYAGNSLLAAGFPRDSAKGFFDGLILKINDLEENKPFEAIYFVDENHFLIAFPNDAKIIEGINRPIDKCGEKGVCFCLCGKIDDKNACYRSGSICEAETLKNYEEIEGFVLHEDGNEDKNLQGLLIEGRNKFPLRMMKKGNKLSFEMVK